MTRPAIALRCVEVTLVATAVAASVPAFHGLFATGGYLIPLMVMAGSGIALAVLTTALRWWDPNTVVAAVAVYVTVAGQVMLQETLWHGLPSARTLSMLRSGLVNGWARALTHVLPIEVTAGFLITPGFLVYAAGFAATTAALRSRAMLAPVPFLLLPLLAALLPGADRPGGLLPVAAVVLTASLLLILLRAVGSDIAGRVHLAAQARFGLPVVLLVVLGAVGVTHLTPIGERDRFDPRDLLRPRLDVADTVTPLALVRSQLQQVPRRELFTVQVSGAAIDRVRTAALDDYDGALWTSGDQFLVAGRRLAPASGRARVRLKVHITGLDQPYLPAAGSPEQIHGDGGIGFCASSGVLAAETARPGRLDYDLVAAVPPADGRLNSAYPARPTGREMALAVPAPVLRAAQELTGGALDPYEKLEALKNGLRNMPYSLDARPGHSLRRLRDLFGTGGAGYVEQYAAAFAVMARAQGFPARVATGYMLRRESRSGDVYTVRTSDAWAWAEVNIARYGWVTFDPSDPLNNHPGKGRSEQPVSSLPTGVTTPVPAEPQAQAAPRRTRLGIEGLPDRLPLILAALVLLIALAPTAVLAEKGRRLVRRRRGAPAQRIAGAWRQSTDRLREAGLPLQHSWTALETAERARARFGTAAAPIGPLAEMVDTACYSSRPPDPRTADDAWRADSALSAALRRDRGLVATARARLNPASLLRRSR